MAIETKQLLDHMENNHKKIEKIREFLLRQQLYEQVRDATEKIKQERTVSKKV